MNPESQQECCEKDGTCFCPCHTHAPSQSVGKFCECGKYDIGGCECGEKSVGWDIGGDIGIQVAIMLDKTLPNKYSSSFLETIERKVADIVNPKIDHLLTQKEQEVLEMISPDELAERIVIEYANLSGRESDNRAYVRAAAAGVLTTLRDRITKRDAGLQEGVNNK